MTTGAQDKKKLVFLIVLGLVAAYLVYTNLLAGPETGPRSAETARPGAAAPAPAVPVPSPSPAAQTTAPRVPPSRSRSEEFHPVLRSRRPEERVDPMSIDPTLRLDLFAKVQAVEPAAAGRNLFQFSTPPPPKEVSKPAGPEPKVVPKPVDSAQAKPAAPPKPVEPPPPPIPLKFYGYATVRANGHKTAYFLDGDDIVIAGEGDVVKRRYKIVRIGPNSVMVEDTDAKRQQSVPLVQEAQG